MSLPKTPDAVDQRGASASVVVMVAVWRQACDRALAALEMTDIVVVLGPAGLSGTFLEELMAGLRERGRAVTFVSRHDLPRRWSVGSALVIEDAAQMDAELLEAICRPPGRRIVLAGLPASAFAGLPAPLAPAPLTVVTLEPLSSGTAAEPSSSMSKVRVAIESGVLAPGLAKLPAFLTGAPGSMVTFGLLSPETNATPRSSTNKAPVAVEPRSAGTAAAPRSSSMSDRPVALWGGVWGGMLAAFSVAGVLLWARAPWAPVAPAPSRVAALQSTAELPPEPGSSAFEQPGGATSAASPASMPAGDYAHAGIGRSLERPAVPLASRTESPSGSEPASPKLQTRPSPKPESPRR